MAVSDFETSGERCAYSMPHYRHILREAKRGYWLPKVRDVAFGLPQRGFCLIRHDVDINPWTALAMARLEREEGVETTYYFRLHTPYYNLMDAATLDVVHEVAGMGHEVGLHYEPGFFLARGLDPIAGTRRDIATFEDLVGFRTHTIAQHQPAQGPVLGEVSPDHPCAYRRELVHEIPYFGDSGYRWREGCICSKLGTMPRLHTLIHSHAWVIDERTWQAALRAHAAELGARVAGEMEAYIESVERHLIDRVRLDRERRAIYDERPAVPRDPGSS
jgi:hypothetical protein